MDRRSFFSLLANAPVVTAAGVAIAPAQPERGIEFLNPQCPTCLAVFDVTAQFPHAAQPTVADRCSPRAVTCRCGWQGELIFFRRQ
jgi:hypothetical protein